MADEAFALSPISARATLPSEADYDAIREAFMETSRGRWFLGEYAKRNRNADTTMVLDAVARIEQTLAAQRQQQAHDGLADALAAIRSAVEQAAEAASAALDGAAFEASLTPIRKGTRIIKEISWRWREIGADGRICDLIDSQISAIEAGCEAIGQIDPGVALSAAFDLIRNSLDGLGDGPAVSAAADASPAPAAPAETAETSAAAGEPAEEMLATDAAEAAGAEPDISAEAMTEPPGPAEEMTADADYAREADYAQDEAVLEMVALEMAEPDAEDDFGQSETAAAEAHVTLPPVVEPILVASEPEPAAVPPSPPPQALSEPSPPIAAEPSTAAAEEISLGSTILANGMLQRQKANASDPLAPIRRMSQAERIAFFS